jgi:imidazolonepropionase
MTPAEALVAGTINAAHTLKLAHKIGSIEAGKTADLLVLNVPNYESLGYRLGTNLVDTVLKNGTQVVSGGEIIR